MGLNIHLNTKNNIHKK